MSWFASWLPSIPTINFSIPASIQGRFVSYFLKKFLGHFFKPGQLDVPQIDSQIGSGYVQVNDLELDPVTINSYLTGIPLVLEEGFVKSVTARIPWPNPLTSDIGFSLSTLHLKLRLQPSESVPHHVTSDLDLAESIASVAENFVQEELSDQQEAGLWESFTAAGPPPLVSEVHVVPGGLDSLPPSDTAYDGVHEVDPMGVSMVATLIERLVARFQFDAQDIQITVTDPDNVTLKFSLSGVQYSTHEQTQGVYESGVQRKLTLHGVQLSTICHVISSQTPSTTRPSSPSTPETVEQTHSNETSLDSSPQSSTSSLDDDTQFQMSQSLAALPPRLASLAESASSSVYHSFVSEGPRSPEIISVDPFLPNLSNQSLHEERTLLSFGSAPIEICLTTPSPIRDIAMDSTAASRSDRYRLDISCGSVAVALQSWQIASVLQTAEKLASPHSTNTTSSKAPSSEPPFSFDVELQCRSLSVLLITSLSLEGNADQALLDYFAHPLSPLQAGIGHTRLLLDTVTAQTSWPDSASSSSLTVGDISAFHFLRSNSRESDSNLSVPTAIPIVITDPYLPSQYDLQHTYPSPADPFLTSIPQPTIPIVDWLDKKCFTFGAKLSHWRTRKPTSDRRRRPNDHNPEAEMNTRQPALQARLNAGSTTRGKRIKSQEATVDVDVAPLHFIVDLQMVKEEGGLLLFMEQVSLDCDKSISRHRASSASHAYLSDEDESASPFEDEPPPHPAMPNQSDALYWTVNIPVIRLSVRAPPPGQERRSGILTTDIHAIKIGNKPVDHPRQLRFAPKSLQESTMFQAPERSTEDLLARLQCGRIVIGCSTVSEDHVVSVLSLGSLQPSSEQVPSLSPQVSISKRDTRGNDNALCVTLDIPSVYISVSKKQLDAFQYWLDDVGQTLERWNGAKNTEDDSGQDSKDTSLIGSRYFVKSRTGSALNSQRVADEGVKTYLLLNITELYCRIHLPRSDEDIPAVRPINVACSDFSANVKLHSAGKIEAIVALMDVLIQDTGLSDSVRTFLSLTTSRSLMAIPVPLLKLKFISSTIPETTGKESKISLSLNGFTFTFYPDVEWLSDLVRFSKSPPGTFESVVPSERTYISVKITDGSARALAPLHKGALVFAIGGLNFVTDIVGSFPETSFRIDVAAMSILAIENIVDERQSRRNADVAKGVSYWRTIGYATLADLSTMKLKFQDSALSSPRKQVIIDGLHLKVHACADTFAAVGAFISDLSSLFKSSDANEMETDIPPTKEPAVLSRAKEEGKLLTASIDDAAFRRVPEIGPAPDMIHDDLPTNLDYLDESFGAAAGLRELTDDDLDEFDTEDIETRNIPITNTSTGVISSVGGETVKVLHEEGINVIENYYDTLPRETIEDRPNVSDEGLRIRILNCDVHLLLYDGYDWPRTRKIIEEEVSAMRKRLTKIKHLVANGQVQEPLDEDMGTLLFNSVYIGLPQDIDAAEPDALIAAIDDELKDDFETGTQSSWQSLKHPTTQQLRAPSVRIHGKKLTRSKTPSIEFCLLGVNAEFNQYGGDNMLVSRTFVTVKDLEILDHIKTSTWKKFLTALRSDSKGNIRETGANMVRIELHNVRSAPGLTSQEARLRAKILPIRLYVDQDAVDFLKKFFSFKDPEAPGATAPETHEGDAYIQMAEIFPIDLKLDYKPRRVDYRALREGRTIELMNFFHFDGAEMTLRHIKLAGITGWPKVFEMLNDLWTPDVKATQLVDVISGVAPIRSMVNVGSGVADLVLLPISQYKKDGRIVRGVQKGATAFVKSTAIEAIKMGARLATGTQVILEQAEGLLAGEFDKTITTEAVPIEFDGDYEAYPDEETEPISKYAQQPADIKEGVQSAYKSLQRNFSSAAQTILAVPMEVYERSGNEGPVRSVVRAVPIAVLKPMIGASEAVSKTLLGLHNTLDPNVRLENEAKYK